jgi:hypothetical protein
MVNILLLKRLHDAYSGGDCKVKSKIFTISVLICVVLAYLIVGIMGVKYVWPKVKQQAIEILQQEQK